MGDIREMNKDEAFRCLAIAKAALQEGNVEKARKFAQKAANLYAGNREINSFLTAVMSEPSGQNGSSGAYSSDGPTPTPHGRSNGTPEGLGSGLRHRTTPHKPAASSREDDSAATPEQKALVQRILAAKDLYEILEVQRAATDDDIKRQYRKMALKLHPDKCRARGAEEVRAAGMHSIRQPGVWCSVSATRDAVTCPVLAVLF